MCHLLGTLPALTRSLTRNAIIASVVNALRRAYTSAITNAQPAGLIFQRRRDPQFDHIVSSPYWDEMIFNIYVPGYLLLVASTFKWWNQVTRTTCSLQNQRSGIHLLIDRAFQKWTLSMGFRFTTIRPAPTCTLIKCVLLYIWPVVQMEWTAVEIGSASVILWGTIKIHVAAVSIN